MDYDTIKKSITNAAQSVGDAIVDAAKKPVDMWNDAGKGTKIGVVAAAGGLTIISAPFIVAAAGGMSIVSALAVLGGGALSAGGFGVAGGIIVTAGGATIAATVGGVITNKFADDPELIALKNNYAALEERVKVQFAVMDKITKGEFSIKGSGSISEETKASIRANCKHAYESYGKATEKVVALMKKLEKSGKYDSKELRKITALVEVADDELQSVSTELKNYKLI